MIQLCCSYIIRKGYFMKISKLLLTSTLASSIAFVGVQDAANAEEGAKTVWGETLPSNTDPDGDGWANVGFDPSVLPQSYQEEIKNLTLQKDTNELSQTDYNEQVASIYESAKQEQQAHQTTQGERPYGGVKPDGITHEEYAELEQNVPNPNEVSTEEYNQTVNNETTRIPNDGGQNKSDVEELPKTGSTEENMTPILGILSTILGIGTLIFSRKIHKS